MNYNYLAVVNLYLKNYIFHKNLEKNNPNVQLTEIICMHYVSIPSKFIAYMESYL